MPRERDRGAISTEGLSWFDLLTRPCKLGQAVLAISERVPPNDDRGFTLVETAIALAIVAAIVIATAIGLTHRGGESQANRAPLIAFLVMAKAHAQTEGDASGNTGATVAARYDPTTQRTTLTLFDGRPFGGAIARATRVAPLDVAGHVSLAGGTDADANAFGLFIGASGATSASGGYLANQTQLANEPACDDARGLGIDVVTGASSQTIALSCATGEIVPP